MRNSLTVKSGFDPEDTKKRVCYTAASFIIYWNICSGSSSFPLDKIKKKYRNVKFKAEYKCCCSFYDAYFVVDQEKNQRDTEMVELV